MPVVLTQCQHVNNRQTDSRWTKRKPTVAADGLLIKPGISHLAPECLLNYGLPSFDVWYGYPCDVRTPPPSSPDKDVTRALASHPSHHDNRALRFLSDDAYVKPTAAYAMD